MLNCKAEPFRTKHRIELPAPSKAEIKEEQKRKARRTDYYAAVRKQRKLASRVEAFFDSEWLLRGRRFLLVAMGFTVMAAIVYQVMKFIS